MTEMTMQRPAPYSGFLDRPLWAAIGLDWEKTLYIILIALAVVTRFYDLGARVISHDESLHTFYSWELSKGKGFVHTPLMHGPMQFHALALSYTLFGASDYTARIPAALCGVVAVGLMYFFRRWLGRAGALLAALFFLISPYLLYYTRYSREDPYTLVFQLIMALALFYYMETRADRYLYLMAAGMSLLSVTKEISFFNIAIWLLFLGLLYLRDMFTAEWPEGPSRRFFGVMLLGAVLSSLVAGGLYWYGRYSPWAREHAPIRVEGDVAIAPEANPYLDGMEYALVAVVLFLAVAALLSILALRGKLREYPAFNMMLLMFTFIFPQLSALPVKMFLDADPLNYQPEGLLKTAIMLVPMFALAAVIGLVWDWKKWLIAAGIFYGIYVPLYTTMFTNGGGFFTGMVGSLGYWLDQQDVHRGSQPWYFYLLVQTPVYEFLPAIGSLLAVGLGFWRWVTAADVPEDTPAEAARQKPGQKLEPVSNGPVSPEPAGGGTAGGVRLWGEGRFPAHLFIGYWIVLAFAAYSYAGEKMPWLTVHMALPMVLLAGWAFGQIVDSIDVQRLRANQGWVALLLLPLTIYALLYGVYRLWFSGAPPFQGNELPQLQATMSFLFALLVAVAGGVGLYFLSRSFGWRQLGVLAASLAGAGLVLLTARAAFYANYINYDYQTEFINYASGAPGVKTVMAQIEEISKRTTDGNGIRIAYGDDESWPMTWYLRDFTGQAYYGGAPTRENFEETPLIISGDNNWTKVEPLIGNRYYQFEYIRMWWPMQEYFGLDGENGMERISNAIRNPDYRQALFNIWFFRDYKKYGELTNVDYSLSRWPVSDRMRFYIRKDIAAQLWPLGVGPSAAEAVAEDPYAVNKLTIAADQMWGSEGVGDAQFNRPRAIAIGLDGATYVADTEGSRIEKFSPSGEFISAWGTPGTLEENNAFPGSFSQVWGLAVDSEGFVYASDTWNHRVQKFTSDGVFVTTWGVFGLADAGLTAMWGPRGVAVDADDNVYVADTGNKRILVFDSEGTPLRQIGTGGTLEGQLDEPTGVAIAPDGSIFVADTWNRRVQVFSQDGAVLGKWNIEGWITQSLDNKPYLTLDDKGNVYVTDPEGYRVIVFSEGGLFQYTFGDFGADNTTFALPMGLAFYDTHLYVVDTNNHRIMRFPIDSDT